MQTSRARIGGEFTRTAPWCMIKILQKTGKYVDSGSISIITLSPISSLDLSTPCHGTRMVLGDLLNKGFSSLSGSFPFVLITGFSMVNKRFLFDL
jgi:hypothetical protein